MVRSYAFNFTGWWSHGGKELAFFSYRNFENGPPQRKFGVGFQWDSGCELFSRLLIEKQLSASAFSAKGGRWEKKEERQRERGRYWERERERERSGEREEDIEREKEREREIEVDIERERERERKRERERERERSKTIQVESYTSYGPSYMYNNINIYMYIKKCTPEMGISL